MTAPDWLAGVTRVAGSGGSMVGGPPRWVWHTYEAGYSLTALNGAKGLVSAGNDVHFTFHPISGDIVQILPASASGKGLVNAAGGVQTNRMGTVCIQVEVIARAARPWTRDLTPAGRAGLARLIGFARVHGIPDAWPAGPPPAYPPGDGNRSASIWTTKAGHYGHSQVPENDHGDPGALDVRVLFASAQPATAQDQIRPGGRSMIIVNVNVSATDHRRYLTWGADSGIKFQRLDSAADALAAAGVQVITLGAADFTALTKVEPFNATSAVIIDVPALAEALAAHLPTSLDPAVIATAVAGELAARLGS